MMRNQFTLLKRELWEHRAIYVTPAVIALLIVLMTLTGQVTISGLGNIVDAAIVGAETLGEAERSMAVTAYMSTLYFIFTTSMTIMTAFYLLDCLYAERKDRSILFWRSLPVTDADTVISKVLVALLVIPLVTFVAYVVTGALTMGIFSAWIEWRNGNPGYLVWSVAPLVSNWTAMLIASVALSLWLSPFVGWFLLVSAWTRRSPFLTGILPLVISPMLEHILFRTHYLRDLIFVRSVQLPISQGMSNLMERMQREDRVIVEPGVVKGLLPQLDIAGFLSTPSLWLGILVCIGLTSLAIFVRRYRDDS